MRSRHLDKLLSHLDDLDTVNLTNLIQRLARERCLLEKLFDTIQEGILVINVAGAVEYSNSAANQLIGVCDKDVQDCPIWKLSPELAKTLPLKLNEEAPQATVIARELDLSYPEHRTVRVYMVPFHLENEQRYAVILSDITEDRISTEERIENERTSSIFVLAAEVAHEIGNPLNSLNIHLQLLRRKLKDTQDSSLLKTIDICTSEVQRLDDIVKNFLEAIKPKALDLREHNLFNLLEEVLSLLGQELHNLDIDIKVDALPDMPQLNLDGSQIKQVLFNILKNAMESMSGGGQIHIYARLEDDSLYFYIADEGKGISQEDVGRLFRPFFTTKEKGHGLGMMIVQRIMRAHGGQVWIDSKPQVGTVITLQFPLKIKRMRMIEEASSS